MVQSSQKKKILNRTQESPQRKLDATIHLLPNSKISLVKRLSLQVFMDAYENIDW